MSKSLFEQIAEALNAPIRQAHERPLSEAAYIDTDPPIFCRAGGWKLDNKIAVSISWPVGTRDAPKNRTYGDQRGAETLAKAIQRDVLDANAAKYKEELERRATEQATAIKREELAQELAALADAPRVHDYEFSLPNRSGTAQVSGTADSVYITLYSVTVGQAKRIIEALK
ncbi:MAG: hypothetical protein ACYC0Z_16855 [Acidobacteriaceae bacterium]